MYLPWIMQPLDSQPPRIVALDTLTGFTYSEKLLSMVSANQIRNERNKKMRAEKLFRELSKEGSTHA